MRDQQGVLTANIVFAVVVFLALTLVTKVEALQGYPGWIRYGAVAVLAILTSAGIGILRAHRAQTRDSK